MEKNKVEDSDLEKKLQEFGQSKKKNVDTGTNNGDNQEISILLKEMKNMKKQIERLSDTIALREEKIDTVSFLLSQFPSSENKKIQN